MNTPPELHTDFRQALLDDENTQRLLRIFIGLAIASIAVYQAATPWPFLDSLTRGAGIYLAGLAALAALVLLRRGQPAAAAQVLVWGIWAGLTLQVCVTNGLKSRSLMGMPIVIVLAGWLLKPRAAIVLCAATLASGLGLVWAENAGRLPLYSSVSPPHLVWVGYAIYVVLAAALAYHLFRGFRLRYEALRAASAELHRQAAAQAASEERMRLVMDAVPALIFHGDRELRCRFANRPFADFFHGQGVPVEGLHLRDILGPAVFDAALPNIHRVLAGERIELEGERKSAADGLHYLEISLVPERDAQGQVVGFFALKRDVSERRRAEQALAEREAQLRLITESVPVMISYGDHSFRCRYANRQYAEFFGYTPESIIDRPVAEVLGEETFARIRPTIESALAGQRVRYLAKRTSSRFGEREFEVNLLPDRDAEGAVKGYYVMLLDITESRRAEDAQRASRQGFVKIFEASPVTILITERDTGRYLDVNHAFTRQFGWRREEVIGRTSLEIGIWPTAEARQRWVEALRLHGTVRDFEIGLLTKEGELRQTVVAAETLDVDGVPCIISLIHDITERARAETEVRRLNAELERRVEARTAELQAANRELESFAYSISHDLRAPLRGIDGFSLMALDEYGDRLDAQGRGYLERVRAAAQRMGLLIDDILELSRVSRQAMRQERVDLGRLAAELLDELRQADPQRPIEAEIAPDCTATGDPRLLRVLLQNLLENAWKYSARQPEARIAFGAERLDSGETAYFVRDNGVGFDMKYADRLFLPFQRLHDPKDYSGSGIGLATVGRIVHRHGGRVWAESAPGRGTTLRFTLGNRAVS